MDAAAHFTTLARYDAWATHRLLDAVARVGEDDYRRDLGLFFKSIHGTLNHLAVAQHIWFSRFAQGQSPRLALDAELDADLARVATRLRVGAGDWAPLIARFSAAQWGGRLDYVTTKGVPASLPFVATLTHVFNHGTHHRGQITAALTALGHPGPVLDLVYMLQEEQNKS